MELTSGSVINLSKVGKNLTLRTDLGGSTDCLTYDLNDEETVRTSRVAPFPFAGQDADGNYFTSAALIKEGDHSLLIRECYNGAPIKDGNGLGQPADKTEADFVQASRAVLGLDKIISVTDIEGETIQSVPSLPTLPTLPAPPSNTVPNLSAPGGFLGFSGLGFASFGGGRKLSNDQSERKLQQVGFTGPDLLEGDFRIAFSVSLDGKKPFAFARLPTSDLAPYSSDVFGVVTGELRKWHKITLGFQGPISGENGITNPGVYRAPSAFADFRCDVLFKHAGSRKTRKVPCYYAGDGNAANSGAVNGKVWLAHFSPDETGVWKWEAEFKKGTNVAQNGNGDSAGFFDGVHGSFQVDESDKTGTDLRAKGRLQHVGEHYLKFAESEEYFLQAGPESPANFLAYDDFDNTPNNGRNLKSYEAHTSDYIFGHPTWNGNKGRGIIGALNYLASKGMNAITVNVLSDDGNVFPWTTRDGRKLEFDVSKLNQWGIVFDHAQFLGITIHLKFQETDDEDEYGEPSFEDHFMSEERKLLIREMVARFGHHLGIVYDFGLDPVHPNYVALRSEYLRAIDPYNSPIVVQSSDPASVYATLLNVETIDGASLQVPAQSSLDETVNWVSRSASKKNKWTVSVDRLDNTNEAVPPDSAGKVDFVRENVLYGNLMGGGNGCRYLFGNSFAESDITAQDFRSRDTAWTQAYHAITFFSQLPLDSMASEIGWLVENNFDSVFATPNGSTIVYHKTSSSPNTLLDFPQAGKSYTVQWFDPRTGTTSPGGSVIGGTAVSVGRAPSSADYLALLTCTNC